MKHFTLFIVIMFLVSGVLFGTVWANWLECAYGECSDDSTGNSLGTIQSGGQIGTHVIIGAGNFLKSHSDFQLFLNKYELSELNGVCFEELQSILNNCISSMESTVVTYYDLKNIASVTPYDQSVIDNLKDFDYDGFLQGRNLNPAVFQEVRGFLSQGDVTGAICDIYSKTLDLLDLLYRIKGDIDKNTLPGISNLWELNQEYSNALLYGQYIAWIFKSII